MSDNGPPTRMARQARRAAERRPGKKLVLEGVNAGLVDDATATAAAAEAWAAAAAKVEAGKGAPGTEDEIAIQVGLDGLAAHPAAAAESHEGAAYLNMQSGAIQNQRTGRHFLFSFPADMSVLELFEVVGWMTTNFRKEIERRHQSGEAAPGPVPPRLHVARSMPREAKPS